MHDDGLGTSLEAYLLRADRTTDRYKEMWKDAEKRASEASKRASRFQNAIEDLVNMIGVTM